jgi:Flp pilus assembly protein CpaB
MQRVPIWPGALALLCSLVGCHRGQMPIVVPTPFEALEATGELQANSMLVAENFRVVHVPDDALNVQLVPASTLGDQHQHLKVPVHSGELLRLSDVTTEDKVSTMILKKGRWVTLPMAGAEFIRANDRIDIAAHATDPQTKEGMSFTVLQNVTVESVGELGQPAPDGLTLRPVSVLVLPEEGEVLVEANRVGQLHVFARNPEDADVIEERGRAPMATVLTGERINSLLKKRMTTIQAYKPQPSSSP